MMATAVGVLRGRGRPSFFMNVSRSNERKTVGPIEQAVCRLRRSGIVLLGLPLVTACVKSPLSTLDPASEVTRSVASLWWTMAAGTGLILLLMVALAGWAVLKNPPQAPGRKGVRILLVSGGLLLPTVVITALLTFGLRLDEAQWPSITRGEAADAFHVDVIAHQWWWEVRYPGLRAKAQVLPAPPPVVSADDHPVSGMGDLAQAPRTINLMHVPAGVPIHVRLMSSDVIHGFWVPRISGKLDAVPGKVNRLRMFVDTPGEYAGVCAEFCGDGHTYMPFMLVAHPPEAMQEILTSMQEGSQ